MPTERIANIIVETLVKANCSGDEVLDEARANLRKLF
jgi:hypothetical protein